MNPQTQSVIKLEDNSGSVIYITKIMFNNFEFSRDISHARKFSDRSEAHAKLVDVFQTEGFTSVYKNIPTLKRVM